MGICLTQEKNILMVNFQPYMADSIDGIFFFFFFFGEMGTQQFF